MKKLITVLLFLSAAATSFFMREMILPWIFSSFKKMAGSSTLNQMGSGSSLIR